MIVHVVALWDKILRHKENLLNTIKLRANSAKSESFNAQIKGVIARAKGFRNIDNFKFMVYLKCSDITVPLNNRPLRYFHKFKNLLEISFQKNENSQLRISFCSNVLSG